MSRGLGKLQRAILNNLDVSRRECHTYHGSATCIYDPQPFRERGWVRHHGRVFWLPDDVYDLLCVSHYVARLTGGYLNGVNPEFSAGFSRAVKGLVASRLLALATVITPKAVEVDSRAVFDGDEVITVVNRRQVRFVRKGDALAALGGLR